MTRWIAAPVAALFALMMSGFLSDLQRTTELSVDMAKSSESAPRTTEAAAREVRTLPQLAELTNQQASAFRALAVALESSAKRIVDFNGLVRDQGQDLGELADSMAALDDPLNCLDETLETLLVSSRTTPRVVGGITDTMSSITDAQNKAIRHLKSINKKLTTLGLVVAASGVEPPPPAPDAPVPLPDFDGKSLEC
ncbi:MAG TPA: hypothetical protein VEV82_05340 [Actinomycetota bacterium]|nr:hypothetical protein [Actinomycetota bacterium]